MWRRWFLPLCLTLFLSLAALEVQADLKIGVAGAHSGDLAPYGIPARDALALAAEKLNAAGGLLGQKVQLVVLDDVCKPGVAADVANKMVAERVVAVIGHICSGATKAALPIYQAAKIPVISPSATSPELTLEGRYPLFFRSIPHDAKQAMVQADFIVQKLKAKTAVIVHDKGDYGKALALLVEQELKKRGVKILMVEGVTPGAVNYSALVRKIGREAPDVVAFGGYHPEATKIVTQARKRRIKSAFISGDGVKDPSFIKIGRHYVEGYYATSPADISGLPQTQQVNQELADRGQSSGNFGLQAHAAFTALVQAIKRAGSTDPEAIKKQLHAQTVDTVLGKIHFDPQGDIVGAGISLYQVKDAQFVDLNFQPEP
ncbi:MAG: branched-chain amino acid ABC transporter substrate-binding protein [bacterium]|nr:branched-chain amino acid ABC transporter substrate-binding protein [bacterium]